MATINSITSLRQSLRKRKTHSKVKSHGDPLEELMSAADSVAFSTQMPTLCVNEVSEDSAREFAEAITTLEQDQNVDKILVKIDSYGGDMYAVLSMIEVIESCKKPIYTMCSGKAMSAGALLLSAGKKRFIGKYSTVMIHEVQGDATGSTAQVHADASEQLRLQVIYINILAKNCNKKVEQVKSLLHSNNGGDVYLTPKQAKEFGLIDKIGLPKVSKKTVWHFSLEADEE